MNEEHSNAPSTSPPGTWRASGLLAATGVALMVLSMMGAAIGVTIWAASRLIGFPDLVMYTCLIVAVVPLIWCTIWAAGRAWHVEERLEQGLDVDQPVFRMFHYWKRPK